MIYVPTNSIKKGATQRQLLFLIEYQNYYEFSCNPDFELMRCFLKGHPAVQGNDEDDQS